jgi:hypothetical protein
LVVTTVNAPNACLLSLSEGAARRGIPFLVAGDTKSPPDFSLPYCEYYGIGRQVAEFPRLCELLPTRHYVRKNVAYLAAIRRGATEIQETDDDNFPRKEFWSALPRTIRAEVVRGKGKWLNVYRLFSDGFIWPRGLPLEHVHGSDTFGSDGTGDVEALIVQGLADDNPDVDAVFRMTCDLPFTFNQRGPVWLAPGTWCPFNSQNTIFRKAVFPLLYLPSKCTFRMTDIWRSFVAQRCLWETGGGVIFHSPTVYQERNEHNLLRDFEDEVPGYRLNDKIRLALDACRLDRGDMTGNLVRCYASLVEGGFLPPDELPLVRRWCEELEDT